MNNLWYYKTHEEFPLIKTNIYWNPESEIIFQLILWFYFFYVAIYFKFSTTITKVVLTVIRGNTDTAESLHQNKISLGNTISTSFLWE